MATSRQVETIAGEHAYAANGDLRVVQRLSRSARTLKRALDIAVAALCLIALSPLLVVLALAIKLDSEGPIFFRQWRIGTDDVPFELLKFRTMVADADERKAELAHLNKHAQNGGNGRMFKIVDDPRVTRVGRFLRRHYLDELPQLLNVLRAEMSLVGPRPLIPVEDQYAIGWARTRLDVRPGMTGLWQVSGGDSIPFEEMVELDCEYVRRWSFRRDLQLLWRTLPVVVRGGDGSH
jgi:lipopolysaccharide/colanic/teichoic acid biosynthesis glycosyltransferase